MILLYTFQQAICYLSFRWLNILHTWTVNYVTRLVMNPKTIQQSCFLTFPHLHHKQIVWHLWCRWVILWLATCVAFLIILTVHVCNSLTQLSQMATPNDVNFFLTVIYHIKCSPVLSESIFLASTEGLLLRILATILVTL